MHYKQSNEIEKKVSLRVVWVGAANYKGGELWWVKKSVKHDGLTDIVKTLKFNQ